MKIEVTGHSGCRIEVVRENGGLYVYKSTSDPKYCSRLQIQAEKQRAVSRVHRKHIRVPEVYDVQREGSNTSVKMQYIFGKNFIEFFEQSGFEHVEYLVDALKDFIDYEISQSPVRTVSAEQFRQKFSDVRIKCLENSLMDGDEEMVSILSRCDEVFGKMEDLEIPVGLCHGDLTFSNILFTGNNYFLIDFLDGFVETPLQDIVKLRQDTFYHWSQLMYTRRFDSVRQKIVCDKIDREIDNYFTARYDWYVKYYQVMQLMNFVRILPYAREKRIIDYLKRTLLSILNGQGQEFTATEDIISQSENGKLSLIVPAAADKPEYEDDIPYIFAAGKDNVPLCLKCIEGLDLDEFDNVYVTILKKHDERFAVKDILERQLQKSGMPEAKVVVLDDPTADQAETVFRTIEKEHINGSVFIKDADSFFRVEMADEDGVAIFPIEELDTLSPKDKSYVALDDMFYITNIIEKSVVGHYISAGGYKVDSEAFVRYYQKLRGCGRLYLSHIIYAMLLDKATFRPMIVEDYKDWGTRNDYHRND